MKKVSNNTINSAFRSAIGGKSPGDLVTILRMRHAVFAGVRDFFDAQGFIEVHTPLLVKNPGLEPYLIPFQTELVPGMGSSKRETLYLPTSPEYHLKKALSFGLDKIFEITRSFRNGEIGKFHEPEFHMLEWYRAPGTLDEIAKDTAKLIATLAAQFDPDESQWNQVETLTVAEAFARYTDIDLDAALSEKSSLAEQAQKRGILSVNPDDDFDTSFGKIMVEKIEKKLGSRGLTIIQDYPASQAALARLKPGNALYAQRFEVYWKGIELANAFQELTDHREQRERCIADQKKRIELYGSTPPLDEEFFEALKKLPADASGIALGLDRLIQCLMGTAALQDILAFSHLNSV